MGKLQNMDMFLMWGTHGAGAMYEVKNPPISAPKKFARFSVDVTERSVSGVGV